MEEWGGAFLPFLGKEKKEKGGKEKRGRGEGAEYQSLLQEEDNAPLRSTGVEETLRPEVRNGPEEAKEEGRDKFLTGTGRVMI